MPDSESESSSCSDENQGSNVASTSSGPRAKKAKYTKYAGSYKYKTKFSKEWMKKYPFISAVKNDPYLFLCNVCTKVLACGHQGVSDVKSHVKSKAHQQQATGSKTQAKITKYSSTDPIEKKVSYK